MPKKATKSFLRKIRPFHLTAIVCCAVLFYVLAIISSGSLETPLKTAHDHADFLAFEKHIVYKPLARRRMQEAASALQYVEIETGGRDDRGSSPSPQMVKERIERRKKYLRSLLHPSRHMMQAATIKKPQQIKALASVEYPLTRYDTGAKGQRRFTEGSLLKSLANNCSFIDSIRSDDLVKVSRGRKTRLLTFPEYKARQAKEFIANYATPFVISEVPEELPLLFSDYDYPEDNLYDVEEQFNKRAIKIELRTDKMKRLSHGDDDLLKIPEVVAAMRNKGRYKIPNIVHFVYFGCTRFEIFHYMAVIGAYRYQKPDLIVYHTNCEPFGSYWDAIRVLTGKKLLIVKRSPPDEVWDQEIEVVEHKTDVARLQIMMEVGGIYLDLDSITLSSMDNLRRHTMVLGEESEVDLANGIILAHRDAWFLRRWFWEYKYFQDDKWALNSCLVPFSLWKLYPTKIHVVEEKIVRPNWEELRLLYQDIFDWSGHYTIHLYQSKREDWDGQRDRSLKEMAVLQTTYGQVARHVIWGTKEPRDITDWIVTCNATQLLISSANITGDA